MNVSSATSSPSLAKTLSRLARFVHEAVEDAKNKGLVIKTRETFVRQKIESFQYKDNGMISCGWANEFFEKEEWHWRHQHEFLETAIKQSEAFRVCMAEMQGVFPNKNSDDILHRFARAIATEGLGEPPLEESIVDFVSRFLADLHQSPIRMQVLAWVDGIWLRDNVVKVGDLILRRPTASDLEQEQSLHLALHAHVKSLMPSVAQSAIAEFTIHCSAPIDAQTEIDRLMGTLRLFRLGSVRSQSYSITPNSVLMPGPMRIGSSSFPGSYKFALSTSDEAQLEPFLIRIKQLMSIDHRQTEVVKKPAELAFNRYSEALFAAGSLVVRITAGITCLEALFLKGPERSELSYKLSLRVASLLRLFDLNALEVQTNIHRAYEIRSTHIHGGEVEKERLKNADDLCRKILEYTRLAVLTFLQLQSIVDKDEFIGKLDRSLLEPKSLEKVKEQVQTLLISK